MATTRGDKRVLSTVAVDRSRLYIVNASIKCRADAAAACEARDAGAGGPAVEEARAVTASFDIAAA